MASRDLIGTASPMSSSTGADRYPPPKSAKSVWVGKLLARGSDPHSVINQIYTGVHAKLTVMVLRVMPAFFLDHYS